MHSTPDENTIKEIETRLQHAEARMMQAEMVDDSVRVELYQEATDLLIQCETMMKGSGAWLMACLHARRENREMCLQWLERALSVGMLPDVEVIRDHPHFQLVKETEWFVVWSRMRAKRGDR